MIKNLIISICLLFSISNKTYCCFKKNKITPENKKWQTARCSFIKNLFEKLNCFKKKKFKTKDKCIQTDTFEIIIIKPNDEILTDNKSFQKKRIRRASLFIKTHNNQKRVVFPN